MVSLDNPSSMNIQYSKLNLMGLKKLLNCTISTEVYNTINDLGIKKQFRGVRAGRKRNKAWDVNEGSHLENITCLRRTLNDYTIQKNICFDTLNTRSIRNKMDQFLHHLVENNYDICTLTETWIMDNDDICRAQLNKNGYQFYDVQRNNRSGDGTGIICKKEFEIRKIGAGAKLLLSTLNDSLMISVCILLSWLCIAHLFQQCIRFL